SSICGRISLARAAASRPRTPFDLSAAFGHASLPRLIETSLAVYCERPMSAHNLDLQHLIVERDGAIAVVTANRPKGLNALNSEMLDELRRTVLALKHDDGVRAIVVTGAGEKSFIAGADINELAVQSPTTGRDHAMRGQHVLDLIEHLGKPVIAAINGYALG